LKEKIRRTAAIIFFLLIFLFVNFHNGAQDNPKPYKQTVTTAPAQSAAALSALDSLPVKGRAPKTGYQRKQFLSEWGEIGDCDVRNLILKRDLSDVFIDPANGCWVMRGKLLDPYTGKEINFQRGAQTSGLVQIDHVVALSDAWQKGAQQLSPDTRNHLANDPLNLLAVDGKANQKKSDGDAATWLPPNKSYRCRYVARQVAVKTRYHLWVTTAEKEEIKRQLMKCPGQVLPVENASN
jgi:hypothetical protein